jgi:hypothetical protein
MKPTEFFEVFEITVISGSLILKFGLFFFPKNRNWRFLYILQYIKRTGTHGSFKIQRTTQKAIWDL